MGHCGRADQLMRSHGSPPQREIIELVVYLFGSQSSPIPSMRFSNSNIGSEIHTRIILPLMIVSKRIEISDFRSSHRLHKLEENKNINKKRSALHCTRCGGSIVPSDVTTGLSFVLVALAKRLNHAGLVEKA